MRWNNDGLCEDLTAYGMSARACGGDDDCSGWNSSAMRRVDEWMSWMDEVCVG